MATYAGEDAVRGGIGGLAGGAGGRSQYAGGLDGDTNLVSRDRYDDDEEGDDAPELISITEGITRSAILAFKADMLKVHSKRRLTHREDEKFYKRQFEVPSPEPGKDPIRLPTSRQIVHELRNHLVAEVPMFQVLPRTQNQSDGQRSGKQSVWLNGFWRKQHIGDLAKQMITWDAVRGPHVLRVAFDAGAWPLKPVPPVTPRQPQDFPDIPDQEFEDYLFDLHRYDQNLTRHRRKMDKWKKYTEDHLPIRVECLDPYDVLWEPGSTPQRAVVVWNRSVDEILQRFPVETYPELHNLLGKMPAGTIVTWNEYWDTEVYAYWVEGASSTTGASTAGFAAYWVVDPTDHEFGFFPFVIDGPNADPFREPEWQYPSIYADIKEMLTAESTYVSQLFYMYRRLGWLAILVKTENYDNPQQRPRIDLSPGATNFVDKTDEVGYIEPGGGVMQILSELINGIDDYMDKATGLADVLRGKVKGRGGHQQQQVAQMAAVALTPYEQCMQRTFERASQMVFQLIRTSVRDKITVIGPPHAGDAEASLGPDDVKVHGEIKVQLKTKLPIDDAAKHADLMKMEDKGWISGRTAARMAGIENPEDEHAEWEAEQIRKNPLIMMAEAIRYSQEHDPDLLTYMQQYGLIAQAQKAVQQAMAPAQPPGGPPGQPPQGGDQRNHPPGQPPTPPAAGSPQQAALAQRQAVGGGRATPYRPMGSGQEAA